MDEARSARKDQADRLAGRRTAVVEVRGNHPSGVLRAGSDRPETVIVLDEQGQRLAYRTPARASAKSLARIETRVEPYLRIGLEEAADTSKQDRMKAPGSSYVRVRGIGMVVCRTDNLGVVVRSCSQSRRGRQASRGQARLFVDTLQ